MAIVTTVLLPHVPNAKQAHFETSERRFSPQA
jgi:hypothetical protein